MNYQRLRDQLSLHESRRALIYDDATGKPIKAGSLVVGNPTIGVGRNLAGKGLSDEEQTYLLNNDIRDVLQMARSFPWFELLDDVRQNAVLELIFNMGLEKFRTFKRFIAALGLHSYELAAHELTDSKWQHQVDPILGDGKGRADVLIRMILTGAWPT
jgi:lysozyme